MSSLCQLPPIAGALLLLAGAGVAVTAGYLIGFRRGNRQLGRRLRAVGSRIAQDLD